jgi:Kef-type K+ transport system membrane component KefB
MPIQTHDSVAGIKYGVLIAGFVGAALSLSYAKEMTRTQALTAITVGTVVSVMATPLALHYLALPEEFDRAIAFFTGLAAMRAVPVLFSLIDRLRDIKLPWLSDPKE